jgi:Predicted nucleic acid-binding protein, contains PIN domain
MSKKIFVDSDVILDLLAKREPHYEYSASVFTLCDTKKIELYTTSLVFSNVYYILRKIVGIEKAKESLRKLRLLVRVMSVEEKEVDLALNSKFSDFENAVQYYTAVKNKTTILLTRNVKEYKVKDLVIQTPEQFVTMDNQKQT